MDFYLDEDPYALGEVIATELNDDEAHLEWGFDASREIEDYSVYRGLWDDDFMDMTYVGNTTQNQFIDYDWGVQTSGVYKWAVVVNYTNNSSVPTYSNYLDKDMETVVNIDVTLNSAESPEGTEITLVNTSEPYLMLEYTLTMDATGMATIDPIRKGEYEIEVSRDGYYIVNDVASIYDETDLSYLLYEIIAPVTDLYVNPNGFATWTPGSTLPVAFTEYRYDDGVRLGQLGFGGGTTNSVLGAAHFADTEIREVSWLLSDAPTGGGPHATVTLYILGMFGTVPNNNDVLWTATVSNVDGQWNTYELPTPVQSSGGGFFLGVAYNGFVGLGTDDGVGAPYDYVPGSHFYSSDITQFGFTAWEPGFPVNGMIRAIGVESAVPAQLVENSEIPAESEIQPELTMLDAPVYVADPTWAVANNAGDRSLEGFKVWLDDVLSGEPTVAWWDYEANEALVEGQTYHAEVASVYTTGISAKEEYYFTYYPCTYFDGPTSVTADVVIGTMDALITWTPVASNVSGDDVVGVNVFRDGELIAMVPVGTNFYVDEQLGAADYEYCITNFYQSEAQSCQVCDMVTVTPGGYVNGYVTEFATGDPIEGAQVLMVAGGDPYFFTTDATGYYEGEVVAGTYDYVASASGYASETLEDVLVDFGTTVSQDFMLKEFPYPVGEVIATEINDNSVLVNWSGQGGGGGDEIYLDFEDGMPDGFLVSDDRMDVADGNLVMDGDGLLNYASGYYDQSFSDFVFEFEITRTGDAATLGNTMGCFVRADGFAGTGVQNGYAYSITQSGSWWYAKYVNGVLTDWTGWLTSTAINTGLGTSNIVSIEASGSTLMYFINGTLIHTIVDADYAEGYCNVMAYDGGAGAEVTYDYYSITPGAKAMDYDVTEEIMTEKKGTIDNCIQAFDSPGKLAKGVTLLPPPTEGSLRAIAGYNVYVGPCDGDEEDMTFIGYTLDQTYTDNTWAVAEPGIYKWAVEVVYDFNASAFAFSNCLDKDMETMVTVEVTTNSGDSPEGTDVVFTNVSEMADPPIVFETELDASGIYTWEEFRKGTYDIYVHLNGFADIMVEDVYIWDEAYFEFMLEELLAPPSDLYVTPMGYATWSAGGIVPFEPFLETFDEGLPETWTVIVGGSN